MTTLYDQNPEAWDEIAAKGWPNIAAIAKRFSRHIDLDAALGYSKASYNWSQRRGSISPIAEQSAKNWLAANPAPDPEPKTDPALPSDGVLMVIPPAAKIDAVRRVLAALGCEVINV
jgi:hypothetical protein